MERGLNSFLVTVVVLAASLLGPAWPARGAEVLLPESWAGTWEITIIYENPATGSVAAVDHITDAVCPLEAFGLALLRSPVSCTGTATDTHLTVDCASQVSASTCSIQGNLQLDVERSGETLAGAGQWSATVTGDCGPLVSGGQAIRVSGVRQGGAQGACAGALGLAQKFVSQPAALALAAQPFTDFVVDKLEIGHREFEAKGSFALGPDSDGIAPLTEPVSVQVGAFTATLPAGSFRTKPAKPGKPGHPAKPLEFKFEGPIEGVWLEAKITQLAEARFAFKVEGKGLHLGGTRHPVPVALTVGGDGGSTAVSAERDHHHRDD
jgi:hypothetical protein